MQARLSQKPGICAYGARLGLWPSRTPQSASLPAPLSGEPLSCAYSPKVSHSASLYRPSSVRAAPCQLPQGEAFSLRDAPPEGEAFGIGFGSVRSSKRLGPGTGGIGRFVERIPLDGNQESLLQQEKARGLPVRVYASLLRSLPLDSLAKGLFTVGALLRTTDENPTISAANNLLSIYKNVPSRKSAGWNIFMGGFVGIISSPSSSLSPAAGHGWGPL